MGRCRCDTLDLAGCLCHVADSDDIDFSGSGSSENPHTASVIYDPDPDNLSSTSVSGLLTLLPDEIANPPRAHIIKSADQTIPSSTVQILSFNVTEDYDTAGMYDGASNPFRLNITSDGLYICHARVGWEEPTTDAFASFTVVSMPSDTDIMSTAAVIQSGPGTPTWRLSVSTEVELQSGTYLECRVFQNTGGDLICVGAHLVVRRVAPIS